MQPEEHPDNISAPINYLWPQSSAWEEGYEAGWNAHAEVIAHSPVSPLGDAWQAVLDVLPENWHGPSVYQKDHGWVAYAIEHSLLRPMPVTVIGYATVEDALFALRDALEAR